MKKLCKLFSFIGCIMLVIFVITPLTVNAASASLSASVSSVSAGSTVTYTVHVSGVDSATSAAVTVSYSSKFELVSGEWLKSGLADFNTETRQGALAFTSAGSMNGSLFRVTLKAKSYDASAQSVSVNVQIKHGGSSIMNQTVSASTKITCASHNYGGWSGVSAASCTKGGTEQRSCSVCGIVETRNTSALGHSWGAYSETKEPTCTAPGTQTRTCSRCHQTETKSVKATGHNMSKSEVTKEPTCTEKGEKTGTCKTCGEKITEVIEAVGHKFGEWKEVTTPTFSENGTEKRICTECHAEETRETQALGYEFSEPTDAKESVFVYYDITTTINQNELNLKGYVNGKFAIPEGTGSDVRLYYVTETGLLEEVVATVSEDKASIEAKLTKLGTYAVCKMLVGEANVEVEDIPSNEINNHAQSGADKTSISGIIIAILGSILIAETIVVLKLIYMKKKR